MSSKKDTTYYMELQPGDAVQEGDQWLDEHGQWQSYGLLSGLNGVVGYGVRARRPIGQVTYEEVPGSRTTQPAVEQTQRERIAYEELRPGTEVQPGDQYRNTQGRWVEYSMDTSGVPIVGQTAMARRPYKISTILEIGDALASAQAAATQLQGERDEARLAIAQVKAEFNTQADVLAEVRADEKRLFDDLELLRSEYIKLQSERDELRVEIDTVKGDRMNLREAVAAEQRAHKRAMTAVLQACKERDEARTEQDLARSEVARLSTELWARKPLEDRVTSLTDELAQAREEIQNLLKTITDNADQFANTGKILEKERDEASAKSERLQGLIDDLLDEPTARQVQDMLRTWATELDWSAGCFDSVAREQIDTIQKTLVAVIERIEGMVNPEGDTDGE